MDKKNVWAGLGSWGMPTRRHPNGELVERKPYVTAEFGMRGNVWKGKTSSQENPCGNGFEHPATMPKWLAHDLILSWSNTSDTILDPFAGSGTTGMVALELARKAILIELNPEYCKLIKQRCNVTPGLALDFACPQSVAPSVASLIQKELTDA